MYKPICNLNIFIYTPAETNLRTIIIYLKFRKSILMFYSIHQVCYLFAHNKPLITLSPGNIDPASSAVMGNLLNPAYVSNFLENYPVPMSFVNRVKNIFFSIVGTMTFKGTTRGLVQTEVRFYSYGAYGGQ